MHHGRRRFIAGFLALPLLPFAVFVVSPYAQAFYLALTDWRGMSGRASFVGLDNFARLLDDEVFLAGLRNNVIVLAVLPVLTVGIGLFIASLLNVGGRRGRAGVRGAQFYKFVYFFPQLLAVSIIAILWQFVYSPNNGLLNGVLGAVGLDALRRPWLGDPGLALPAVIAIMMWSCVGFYVVLFSAAIQSIPRDLFEAAALDGAGRLATFRRITLPLIWENVQVAFVYLGVVALDGFALVHILTQGSGGPDSRTEMLALGLWRNAFVHGKFGYASAMGVTIFFLTLALAVLTFRMSRRDHVEM